MSQGEHRLWTALSSLGAQRERWRHSDERLGWLKWARGVGLQLLVGVERRLWSISTMSHKFFVCF